MAELMEEGRVGGGGERGRVGGRGGGCWVGVGWVAKGEGAGGTNDQRLVT